VETTYVYERPAVLMPAAFAPMSAARILPVSGTPWAPQVHQMSAAQRERLLVPPFAGIQGTNGFAGKGVPAGKPATDARGVPPRGRPPV
jgi:hypothetical protein